jgi:hypothetical protein
MTSECGGADINLQLDLDVREGSHLAVSQNYHKERMFIT